MTIVGISLRKECSAQAEDLWHLAEAGRIQSRTLATWAIFLGQSEMALARPSLAIAAFKTYLFWGRIQCPLADANVLHAHT